MPNTQEIHQAARSWVKERLGLVERPGEDRLWDGAGRSYKVKARTVPQGYTSFNIGYREPVFDHLVGVIVHPGTTDVKEALIVDRATFDQYAHNNADTRRFRLSKTGVERSAVEWL